MGRVSVLFGVVAARVCMSAGITFTQPPDDGAGAG